jgi:hypothetical protein
MSGQTVLYAARAGLPLPLYCSVASSFVTYRGVEIQHMKCRENVQFCATHLIRGKFHSNWRRISWGQIFVRHLIGCLPRWHKQVRFHCEIPTNAKICWPYCNSRPYPSFYLNPQEGHTMLTCFISSINISPSASTTKF